MDTETQELLKRNLTLAEENNKMLKVLVRQVDRARYISLLKFILFVAIAIAAYYYVRPYLQDIQRIYEGLNEGLNIIFRNNMMKP